MNARLLVAMVFLSVAPACGGGDDHAVSEGAGGSTEVDAGTGGATDAGDAGTVPDASDAAVEVDGSDASACGGSCAIGSICQPDGYCYYPCSTVLNCKLYDNRFNACIDGFCAIIGAGP